MGEKAIMQKTNEQITCYANENSVLFLKYFSHFVFVQAKHHRKVVSYTFSGCPCV